MDSSSGRNLTSFRGETSDPTTFKPYDPETLDVARFIPNALNFAYRAFLADNAVTLSVPPVFSNAQAVDSASFAGRGASFTVYRRRIPPQKTLTSRTNMDGLLIEIKDKRKLPEVVAYKVALIEFSDKGEATQTSRHAIDAAIMELYLSTHRPILQHPNLVDFLGLAWGANPFNSSQKLPVLMVEFAEYGSLAQLQQREYLGVETRRKLCLDVCKGLHMLHSCGIVHGDIKAQNVLVFKDAEHKYRAKVSDFGYSQVTNAERGSLLLGGTRPWKAPEAKTAVKVSDAKYTDIYSLSLFIWCTFAHGQNIFKLFVDPSKKGDEFYAEAEKLKETGELAAQNDIFTWYWKAITATTHGDTGQFLQHFQSLQQQLEQLQQNTAQSNRLEVGIDDIEKILCAIPPVSFQALEPLKQQLITTVQRLGSYDAMKRAVTIGLSNEPQQRDLDQIMIALGHSGSFTEDSAESNQVLKSNLNQHFFTWRHWTGMDPSVQRYLTTTYIQRGEGEVKKGMINPPEAFLLTALYINGYGVDKNTSQAIRWLFNAWGVKHPLASAYGYRIARAIGRTPDNPDSVIETLELMALRGSRTALEDLATLSKDTYDKTKKTIRDVLGGTGANFFWKTEMLHGFAHNMWIRTFENIPIMLENFSQFDSIADAAGAKLAASFLEKNLLTTQIRQLHNAVGKHTWEDSMEIQASLYWSPSFLDNFKSKRGYNVVKYLPLLFHKSTSFQAARAPYNTTFTLDGTPDNGQSKYLQDYRLTLNEGYQEYLQYFEIWAASLGLSHSCQVGYGVPLDVLADVSIVSVPELESLGFLTPDQMSQFVGPAHLGRRNIISTEIGAVTQGAYSLTIPSLVNLFHEAFAGGVNSMMIHGMTYTGEQLGSTWPGYTPFQYIYTELWSPKQPAWKHMSDMIAYTSRNQFVLQQGVAKKDLVFYLYKGPYGMIDQYNGTDLRSSGFTYEYLSPANFGSKTFKVSNKVLDAAGAGYRALILDQQQFITAEASQKLVELADAGLPIVVIGSLPSTAIGSKGQDAVTKNISKLKGAKYSNIVFVKSTEDLLNALNKLSVKSRVTVGSDAAKNLYTVWRSAKDSDYLFLFNQGPSGTFEIAAEVEQGKVPYRLDAWTGQQVAMASFKRSSGKVSFQLSLKEGQTAIVAFTSGKSKTSIVSQSSNVIDASYGSDGKKGISVILGDAKEASLTLSNGQTKKIPAASSSDKKNALNIDIGNWDLSVESWVPGPDETKSASVKKVMKLGTQKTLKPWSEISGAQNVSGVGTYTATFKVAQLPSKDSIAILQLGPVLNTIRAWVNDKQLLAIDLYDAQVDVSDYLVKGSNKIKVEVASTLFNAVKARVDYVKANGDGPAAPVLYTSADWQKQGLIGPVSIKTLRKVSL